MAKALFANNVVQLRCRKFLEVHRTNSFNIIEGHIFLEILCRILLEINQRKLITAQAAQPRIAGRIDSEKVALM